MADRGSGSRHDYIVIGAGALGMTVAHRLLEAGNTVTVIEREPLAGGLAAGFEVSPGTWLERFYHHLFRSDRTIQRYMDELGLGERLTWYRPSTVTLRDGRLHQLDSALSLLRFSPIPFTARLRMGMVLAALRLLPNAGPLEGRRAGPWLRRSMGARAYDAVWGPLLRAKFGDEADNVALPWLWARVHDRTARLGYPHGGFQLFYEGLREKIEQLGGRMLLGMAVEQISVADGGLAVRFAPADGAGESDSLSAARVVSTLPTRLTCRLTPGLPDAYRQRFDRGRAYGAHCLILALDRPLTDAYWISVADPGYPFLAVVEHTNLLSPADYGSDHLVYLGNYRPMDDPLFKQSSDDVLAAFTPWLQRINPAFSPDWVRRTWMFGAPFAQPIVDVEYHQHIPPFDTPIDGLYVANMFQVYPHDRGQNYSVQLAERLVRHLQSA
jgi:protoporphyrinogen oxidase